MRVRGVVKRWGAGDFGVRAPNGKSGEIRGWRPVRERRMREEGEGADKLARFGSERGVVVRRWAKARLAHGGRG